MKIKAMPTKANGIILDLSRTDLNAYHAWLLAKVQIEKELHGLCILMVICRVTK